MLPWEITAEETNVLAVGVKVWRTCSVTYTHGDSVIDGQIAERGISEMRESCPDIESGNPKWMLYKGQGPSNTLLKVRKALVKCITFFVFSPSIWITYFFVGSLPQALLQKHNNAKRDASA